MTKPPRTSDGARIRGVILDVDGTLVDSNDAHAQAFQSSLAERGVVIELVRIRRLIGMGGTMLLSKLLDLNEESDLVQWADRRHGEIFEERFLPALRPYPRARNLVERMKERGLRVVVGSSAKQEMLSKLLDLAGVTSLVDDVVSSGDVEQAKPQPDITNAALEKLGTAAEETLILGDTPYDIAAALRIGVLAVILRCGGWPDHLLTQAIARYDDPRDLWLHFDESPFVRKNH